MKITQKAFKEILATIGATEPETGGILGSKNNIVCRFYFDKNAVCLQGKYSPSVDDINQKLSEWQEDDIDFAGIIHSHPNNCNQLSFSDEESVTAIFEGNPTIRHLYCPIITISDKEAIMTVYKATRRRHRIAIRKSRYRICKNGER